MSSKTEEQKVADRVAAKMSGAEFWEVTLPEYERIAKLPASHPDVVAYRESVRQRLPRSGAIGGKSDYEIQAFLRRSRRSRRSS